MSPENAASSRGPGRPRKPIDPGGGPRAILARELQDLLDASGCRTYTNLEDWAGIPRRRLAEAARDGQPSPWHVVEGFVRGCWAFSEHPGGHPVEKAGDMSRWRELYQHAGGALPAESPHESTSEEPVPPLVPETAGAPARTAVTAQEAAPAPARRRGLPRQLRPLARRILIPAASAAVLIAAAIVGAPGHDVRRAAVPQAELADGLFVTVPAPSCGLITRDGLRSPAMTAFQNVRTIAAVSLENASAAVLQGQHDGLSYDWLESGPDRSRAGIQLRWSDARRHWHYCTATIEGGDLTAPPAQVATVAIPAVTRGERVTFQACIWHQHPYTAQCSIPF